MIERALLSRFLEERLLSLFSEGKIFGTVHTCIGQEFSGSAVATHLRAGDTVVSNHRCHGHFLSFLGDAEGLVAELMGRKTGVSGGMGGSQHLHQDGFFSNGIQGGIVPMSAGMAMAHKLRGKGDISVVFIGDGTLGEGVVYETLNIISKWQLPLLIVLEDNKYAQSTAQEETLAGSIRGRFEAFGIETARGDSWNWEDLSRTAAGLIEAIRQDSKPRFLHVETFRLKAHSKGDDTRPRSEIEPFEERDPLNKFIAAASPEELAWIETIKSRIEAAVVKADSEDFPDLPADNAPPTAPCTWSNAAMPAGGERVAALLSAAFAELMATDDKIYFIGEDVLSPYGGAFKASKGLSDAYPGRVLNTPISEAAIVGLGGGLGLSGFRPIVEIMFGDFLGLAFDQIFNHAAKFQQMYGGKISTNLIVRTPMGGGRGYGPTHSQTLDRHFLGIPGLRILAMNHLTTPKQLYAPLLAEAHGPSLVIENKLLYGGYPLEAPPVGYQLLHSSETYPTAWIKPQAPSVDVTLLGYGGTSELLLEAAEILFDEHDYVVQILCPMQIYPFSVTPLLAQITAAPVLLIVEEGQGFAGFGAEVVSQLAEAGALKALSVGRVHPPAHCIPSSGQLEKRVLPSAALIVEAVLKMRAS